MCGIAGEVRFDGRDADVGAVARINEAMHRRGPDGTGVHAMGRAAFGHRRLKILDLSECGAQPMVDNELGLTTVFNGLIYNFRELREELEGHGYRFFSHTDTEVLLKAFHKWGPACVERFLGMFAFAILDRDSGVLTLGRDRLGIKPLYYTQTATRLRFASGLPALLEGGEVDTSIDKVALHHYMSFHSVVPAPRTILNGVRKLPPATVRTVQPDGTFTDHVYWRPEHVRRPEFAGMSSADWRDAVLAALRLAVKRRMVADVPVGVLLSGGLDSSLVVGLLAQEGQRGLKTFSVGFHATAGESGDEFEYSDLVAQEFGTDHQQILVDPHRLLPGRRRGDHGDGRADGQPRLRGLLPAVARRSPSRSRSSSPARARTRCSPATAGTRRWPGAAGAGPGGVRQGLHRPPARRARHILEPDWLLDDDPSRAFIREHFAMPGAETTLDAALRMDSTIMLVDDPVKRVDNMTMAWGLEARVPFLDHELVELAAACPPELKLAHGGKGVLKEAARGNVPDGVIDRPKGYFPVPAIRHLEGAFLDRVRDAVTDPVAKARGLVRSDWLEAMLTDPNTARTNLGSNALWQVALLEMWLQERGI